MEELIAKSYVQALLSGAGDVERENYVTILNAIALAMREKKVQSMIESPIISDEAKTSALMGALGDNADIRLQNLLKLLSGKGRLGLIPAMAKTLNALMQKERNTYEGVVQSAADLDENAMGQLRSMLERYTGASIQLSSQQSVSGSDLRVSVDDLGIEVNFSKERVKEQLIDFIQKAL
jgi:F-type H+-transporting ATPase subunit delta